MDKLILIDGNSLLNRAFYATPLLITKSGTPTNAVYGFVNMLIKMIGDIKPNYIAVAFDLKAKTFRHKMFTEYKGTRKAMPEELIPQFPIIKKLLKLMNIHTIEKEGFEADDLIGTLAKKFSIDTFIITGDKDAFQLVDDSTSVYFTRRGMSDLEIYDINNFTQKTTINPCQIIDLKALMGDSSDNIPGVKGVGEKTALSLIASYQTLDGVYNNIENIKGSLKEKLINDKDIAYLSKQLATININVDVNVTKEDFEFDYPFSESVREMFNELEFRLLVRKDIFKQDTKIVKSEEIQTINVTDFSFIKDKFLGIFSLNFEDEISFNFGDNIEYKIKLKNGFFDEGLEYDKLIEYIKPLFEDEKYTIIVFNRKSLEHKLFSFGIKIKAFIEDVSIKKYLVDYSGKEENFNNILIDFNMDLKTPALSLFKLNTLLDKKLIEDGLKELYYNVELPLSKVLFEMEQSGFKIDENTLYEFKEKYEHEIKELTEKIYELAGERFNVNSPKQLSLILFEKMNLKSGKKTKTSFSTNVDVLESLQDSHEIIPLIIKFRQKQKILSTYIDGFKSLIDKKTGLVHTSFNQLVTSTGRLSSKEPNLQNIPVRDAEGKEIRKFFVARDENHILVGADYSQIELRLLADFSGCRKLIDAYNTGEDIHALTASEVFGVPLENVTSAMRRNAKAVNFGIIYGISEFGLSQNLKISRKQAGEYIARYFERYDEVKNYMNANIEFAKAHGYVTTLLGRKRTIREINSTNFMVRSFGERAAMNMPLQGSSADIIKVAMINVYNRLKKENLKSSLILQVHDELIIDTFLDEKEKVSKLLKEEMEGAVKLKVPMTVEVFSGKSWFDAK
jgi:DNA polymerase-1